MTTDNSALVARLRDPGTFNSIAYYRMMRLEAADCILALETRVKALEEALTAIKEDGIYSVEEWCKRWPQFINDKGNPRAPSGIAWEALAANAHGEVK